MDWPPAVIFSTKPWAETAEAPIRAERKALVYILMVGEVKMGILDAKRMNE